MTGATSDDVRLLYAKSNRLHVQDQYQATLEKCQNEIDPLGSTESTLGAKVVSSHQWNTKQTVHEQQSPELRALEAASHAEVSVHQFSMDD